MQFLPFNIPFSEKEIKKQPLKETSHLVLFFSEVETLRFIKMTKTRLILNLAEYSYIAAIYNFLKHGPKSAVAAILSNLKYTRIPTKKSKFVEVKWSPTEQFKHVGIPEELNNYFEPPNMRDPFIKYALKLKSISRSGWQAIKVEYENVMEHSFAAAIMAYFLAPSTKQIE